MWMPKIIWLPYSIAESMRFEADKFYNLETGGTYMGYWVNADEAVITYNIPAGPKAHHEPSRFEPDQAWQLQKIESHYKDSGRKDSYLGDWHSHPDTKRATLSSTDRKCLMRIIRTPEARQKTPIMLIMTGKAQLWTLTPKVCQLKSTFFFLEYIQDDDAQLKLY
jgi:integrative and conjugative element protein (TIGR02256 family)